MGALLEDQGSALWRDPIEFLLLGDEVNLGLGLHCITELAAGRQDMLLLLLRVEAI